MSDIGSVLLTSINIFFGFLNVTLFIRIILSWVAMSINVRGNPILGIIFTITDPILIPIRRMLQNSPLGGRGMVIDFSPIFAFFLLSLAKVILTYIVMAIF